MNEKKSYAELTFGSFQHPDNYGELLGYRLIGFDQERREACLGLTVRAEHLSLAGKAHGGLIASLLDSACGAAVFTTLGPNDVCSTVEIKVNYFKPVHLGDELEAKANVVFRGKKLCALNALVTRNGEAEPVAMASATFNVLTKEPRVSGRAEGRGFDADA